MTRQSKRLQERLARKNGNSKKIISYGAYYKDDQADGFCFGLSTLTSPHTKAIIDRLIKCTDRMVEHYNKMSPEGKIIEVYECWGLLRQEILKYNKAAGVPVGRPAGFQANVSNKVSFGSATIAATTIDFLTRIGEIKNDNFNGMAFVYDMNGQLSKSEVC